MAETFKGLTEERIRRDNGRPFEVNQYRCSTCGQKDDYEGHETLCHTCGHELDKRNKTARTISAQETKEIIDTTLMYKCPVCKKMYDQPTICCNQEFAVTDNSLKGRKIDSYMCQGCGTIYTKPVHCCSGSLMVRGDAYPDATMEEFLKIRSGVVAPVEGIIQ